MSYDDDDYEDEETKCDCGCEDYEGELTHEFPWDTSPFDIEWLGETKKTDSWQKVWSGVKNTEIDPAQSAADFYLLYGIANNSFIEFNAATIPTDEEVISAGNILQLGTTAVKTRVKEVKLQRETNPVYKLSDIATVANDKFVDLVHYLDEPFRQYIHLACGGEIRHHSTIGNHYYYGGDRRTAWTRWYYIFEKEGPEALVTMSKFFLECGGGGIGGPAWANASDILYQRETFTLGPDEFTSKQLFVDRVFSLEHNNGCILNKLDWKNNRKGRSGASGDSVVGGYMKSTVLNAHAANPTDIDMLHSHASKPVQTLLVDYFDQAKKADFIIHGKWAGKVEKVKIADVKSGDGIYLNWDDSTSQKADQGSGPWTISHLNKLAGSFVDNSNLFLENKQLFNVTVNGFALPQVYTYLENVPEKFTWQADEPIYSEDTKEYFVSGVVNGMTYSYFTTNKNRAVPTWREAVASACAHAASFLGLADKTPSKGKKGKIFIDAGAYVLDNTADHTVNGLNKLAAETGLYGSYVFQETDLIKNVKVGEVNLPNMFCYTNIKPKEFAWTKNETTKSGKSYTCSGTVNGQKFSYNTDKASSTGNDWHKAVAIACALFMELTGSKPEKKAGKSTDVWPLIENYGELKTATFDGGIQNYFEVNLNSTIDKYTGKTPKAGYSVSSLTVLSDYIKFNITDKASGVSYISYSCYMEHPTTQQAKLLANKMTFVLFEKLKEYKANA